MWEDWEHVLGYSGVIWLYLTLNVQTNVVTQYPSFISVYNFSPNKTYAAIKTLPKHVTFIEAPTCGACLASECKQNTDLNPPISNSEEVHSAVFEFVYTYGRRAGKKSFNARQVGI